MAFSKRRTQVVRVQVDRENASTGLLARVFSKMPGSRRNPAFEVVWLGQFPAPPPIP